jgi:anaerobic selenocysteine-containing dehydrogenase
MQTVKAVCPHDCPDTCAMLVTVEDGRAIRMAGDPEHPVTQGFLCTKVAKYLERTYHEGRLLYPQIRVGAKGEGRFRRATWDEALELIATRCSTSSTPTARRRSCRTRTRARWD